MIKSTILIWKVPKKFKFKFLQYGLKLHSGNAWDLEKLRTTIFMHFQAVLDQNLILKKKNAKIPKMTPKKSNK